MTRQDKPPARPVVVEGVLTSTPVTALSRFQQTWLSAHLRGVKVDRVEHPAHFYVLAYDAPARESLSGLEPPAHLRLHGRLHVEHKWNSEWQREEPVQIVHIQRVERLEPAPPGAYPVAGPAPEPVDFDAFIGSRLRLAGKGPQVWEPDDDPQD